MSSSHQQSLTYDALLTISKDDLHRSQLSSRSTQAYASNTYAYDHDPSSSQGVLLSAESTQPALHGQGAQGSELWSLYNSLARGSGTIGDLNDEGEFRNWASVRGPPTTTGGSSFSTTERNFGSSGVQVGMQGYMIEDVVYDASTAHLLTGEMSTAPISHHSLNAAQNSQLFGSE